MAKKQQLLAKKYSNDFHQMFAILKIINADFWKNFSGPFFTFCFPLIFICILGWVLGYFFMLCGAMQIGIVAVSLSSMPQAIFDFKQSSLMKRFGILSIGQFKVLFVMALYYFIIMWVSFFWSLLMSILIFCVYWNKVPGWVSSSFPMINIDTMKQLLQNISWAEFLYSTFIVSITGISCGLLLVSLAKTSIFIQSFGIILMITSLFLSGQFFPIYMVKNVKFMWWVGYFVSPFKCSIGTCIESWYGSQGVFNINSSHIFNFNKDYVMQCLIPIGGSKFGEEINIFNKSEKIVNIIIPFVWIILLNFITSFKFRWSVR